MASNPNSEEAKKILVPNEYNSIRCPPDNKCSGNGICNSEDFGFRCVCAEGFGGSEFFSLNVFIYQ